ncbi:AbrB/MazE/SpoVT family DNA-binding domain-containing protein [Candidatus Lokiarchaeum ossiferum]|uniref:AbrB/MazE/SpoVT family DNA-binding domain-containing protein n=1 Tax=Candidatus Lokiarchaeum ossiferum TaxID=2951803 RepID=UPI00352D3B8E
MKIIDILKNSIKTTIDERGRIYIPKMVREQYNLVSNDELFILLHKDCFYIYSSQNLENLFKNIKH